MTTNAAFPPAQGVRPDWADLPPSVRARIEDALGARVKRAETQPGGFSPGLAALLCLDDGRRVFAKAAGPQPNPDTPGLHRCEITVLRALPAVPGVPRLLAALDAETDGPGSPLEDGWVALICEAAPGRSPALPWHADDLNRVMSALINLWSALTPSPLRPPTVRFARDRVAASMNGWARLQAEGTGADLTGPLDLWSARHLDALVALETRAPHAVHGDTLLHYDVRADNLLLDPDGSSVWFVDWPHACVGAAWFELACFAPSVTMQGGPLPETVMACLPTHMQPGRDDLLAGVACIAGYFTERALRPPPPGLPTVRAFQAAQGEIARAWLGRLTDWA